MKRILKGLGMFYPKGYRDSVSSLLKYSGGEEDSLSWLGGIFLINALFLFAMLMIFAISSVSGNLFIFLAVLTAVFSLAIQLSSYIIPYYAAERRAKAVDAVLPSFYQLLSSYLRSGMTPFQALKSASKKEFGILQVEVDIAVSKALGTQSFSDALLEMSLRIKSEALKRTTELMVRGMESGGSLASLLEESAANLVENQGLRRQIIASSRTYTVMVVFAVLIGAPLLLSISTMFNERLIELTSQMGDDVANIDGLDSALLVGGSSLDPQKLFDLSLITVAITALISSFLIAIISEGEEKYGIKYAIIFVPMSVVFFLVFRAALSSLF